MKQKILIIGASSYVGAGIYFELKDKYNVFGTYNNSQISDKLIKLDLQDKTAIKNVINSVNPDIIIHVANIPTTKACDENPELAKVVNVDATKVIVDEIKNKPIKLIYISSMSIISLYGKTKIDSENMIKANLNDYIILKPFFIIGYSPNTINDMPFNRLLKNLDENTPAVYDTSWNFQPTYLKHISDVIIECIDRNIKDETIHITIPARKTRYDIAKDILSQFGISVTAIDKHDDSKTFTDNFGDLDRLKLPKYTYAEMISSIIQEIKERDKFKI
jgi:dTDP-4-dehydrorhamnose reductase